MSLGSRLKRLRSEKELTIKQMADAAGISTTAYSFYENDRHRPSKIEIYEAMAKMLGCEVSYLTEAEEPKDVPYEETFGALLRRLREARGMSKDNVAETVGIGKSTYVKYEANYNRPGSYEVYENLARVLGCEIDILLEGDDKYMPSNTLGKENNDASGNDPAILSSRKASSAPKWSMEEKKALRTKSGKVLGARLRKLRLERGLSFLDAANAVGISDSTYSKYEYGQRRPRNIQIYQSLAALFECDVEYLTELDERFNPQGVEDILSGEREDHNKSKPPIMLNGSWETVNGITADEDLLVQEDTSDEDMYVSNDIDTGEDESFVNTDPAAIDPNTGNEEPQTIEEMLRQLQKSPAGGDHYPPGIVPEVLQLVSRLSVLLSGNVISKADKEAIMTALNSAYWQGFTV
ncbi:MAG: helix-turn-helix transcriptional regulator [Lachnospiraceae bacterium]|nr:helix-turn-helix transcriptional regulator [Lachnospiraceae bacterium]